MQLKLVLVRRPKVHIWQQISTIICILIFTSAFFTGDVVQANVMGQPTIILGSVQAAIDLLDNRGQRSATR